MDTLFPEQRALVDKLDQDIRWVVACTYRAKRKERCSDGAARHAAITVLEEQIPDIPYYPYFDLSIAVGIIIARAADEYGERFWEGTDQGWKPLWMREFDNSQLYCCTASLSDPASRSACTMPFQVVPQRHNAPASDQD